MAYLQVPDEAIEVLRQLIWAHDNDQWDIADHIISVVDEAGPYIAHDISHETKGEVPWERCLRMARTEIIRQMSDGTGADPSTLRDREVMGRFFPKEVRKKYEDKLTFHQLRACKYAGEEWRKWADWAVEYADEHNGKTAPVRIIRKEIKKEGDGADKLWLARIGRIKSAAYLIMTDALAPRVAADGAEVMYLICEDVLDVCDRQDL